MDCLTQNIKTAAEIIANLRGRGLDDEAIREHAEHELTFARRAQDAGDLAGAQDRRDVAEFLLSSLR